jgi:Methyltransferase domain
MLNEILYPGVPTANWQMLLAERMGLTGLLARIRPRHALEIGTYYGGSLSLIAQFAERVWAVDIDPEVPSRFRVPANADLRIGRPESLVAGILDELEAAGVALNFILIDADHSADGVRRDIETVIHRPIPPREPCFILMHDSGNPACRRGIATADWASCSYVHHVELDFVPGQIIEHAVHDNRSEVWGGLAMAYLSPTPRQHPLVVCAGSATSIAALHRCAADLSLLRQAI